VGFHAHPSDVKIAFELVDLFHHIELFVAALFEENAFAKHEYTHVVAFLNANVCQSYGIVDGLTVVCANDKENIHINSSYTVGYTVKKNAPCW
jgi:hypothetical protein